MDPLTNHRPSGMFLATRPTVRVLATLICLLFVTACDEKSPLAPTTPLNERFTLSPGQTTSIEGVDVSVRFVEVTGDSRCPADAICIQGGDAIVRVVVSDGGSSSDLSLHTGDSRQASAVYRGARISLVELQPYPFSSRTIPPHEYRATFTVTAQ